MVEWYYCTLCDRWHRSDSKIGQKHKRYGISIYSISMGGIPVGIASRPEEENPLTSRYKLLQHLSPSEIKELMRKLHAKTIDQLLERLPEKVEFEPFYYASNPIKEQTVRMCFKVGPHKVCLAPFKIKRGVWPKGLFKYGTVEDIVREAIKQIRSGTPYFTVIQRINLVRVWNKRNPKMWEKLTQVLEKLKEMHERGLI